MDVDNGGLPEVLLKVLIIITLPSSTSVPSPRRQRLDANSSYVEESDEAVLNEVPINIGGNNNDVSGSFESAIDSFEELGQPHTVVSEA